MFLDRVTSLLAFIVLGISMVAYALGLAGFLLLGPVLILGAVVAYTLWTLWWGVVDGPSAGNHHISLRASWPLVLVALGAAVFIGFGSDGHGLSLDGPSAQMTSGLIAAEEGEMTVAASPLGAGTSALGPGWATAGDSAVYAGPRLGVAATAVFSWFGDTPARLVGAVFAALGVLGWGAVALRRGKGWVVAVAMAGVVVSPGFVFASRASAPEVIAFGVTGLALWSLIGALEQPTMSRSAISGVIIGSSLGLDRPAAWALIAAVIAWAMVWRLEPSGWIERDRRRRTMAALGGGIAASATLAGFDAIAGGDFGGFVEPAGTAVVVAVVLGGAGMLWHRFSIDRPASPLPLLVLLLAVPVSFGIVTFVNTAVAGGTGGPSVAAWIGLGPVLIGCGLLGWLWWSDRHADAGVELLVMVGIAGAAVALLGPLNLLPSGFTPFVALAAPTLAVGASWLISGLYGDPEKHLAQTAAIVLAVGIVAVPVWAGWEALAVRPNQSGITSVVGLCDVIDDTNTAVVVADAANRRVAAGLAVGLQAWCGIQSVHSTADDIDNWLAGPGVSAGGLSIVVLDGAVTEVTGLRSVPPLRFDKWAPTVDSVPSGLRESVVPIEIGVIAP